MLLRLVVVVLLTAGCVTVVPPHETQQEDFPPGRGPPEDAWATRHSERPPPEEHVRRGPVVLVTERFSVNVAGDDATFSASYGPHCAPTTYDLEAPFPFVHFRFHDEDEPVPEGVVLHVVDGRDVAAAEEKGVRSLIGSDGQRAHVLGGDRRSASLDSSFSDDPRVNVSIGERGVVVGEEVLEPGEHVDLRFHETVQEENATLYVTSDVRVRYVGEVDLYVQEPSGMCV